MTTTTTAEISPARRVAQATIFRHALDAGAAAALAAELRAWSEAQTTATAVVTADCPDCGTPAGLSVDPGTATLPAHPCAGAGDRTDAEGCCAGCGTSEPPTVTAGPYTLAAPHDCPARPYTGLVDVMCGHCGGELAEEDTATRWNHLHGWQLDAPTTYTSAYFDPPRTFDVPQQLTASAHINGGDFERNRILCLACDWTAVLPAAESFDH